MFEMPEKRDCDCKDGLEYNSESQTCIDCVKAGQAIKGIINATLESGDTDMIFSLAKILIERSIEDRKAKKEKENKGAN